VNKLALAALFVASATAAVAQDAPPQTLITNVHVFDGKNAQRIENASVLIEGNLIKMVSTDRIETDGATVIDGGGRTLMPGLIDAHVHLYWNTPYGECKGHPRGAGSHAKILRMVREDKAISLMDAISKMTYEPAKFLSPMVPQMRTRGRLQQGMTADITIFDPERVTDNSSFENGKNTLPSTGIPYVVVNGKIVVKDSVVQRVAAGVAIRNATTE